MIADSVGSKLSIKDIKAIDLKNEKMETVWEDTINHAKSRNLRAIIQIRTEVMDTIHSILKKKGFLHPPLYLFAPSVDPLNHETEIASFNYYGQECTLMQSLIFHKMAILGMTEIENVYWISPNVRKELNVRDKRRYSAEFTQIDFESSELNMDSCLDLIEEITIETVNRVVELYSKEIEEISGRKLEKIIGRLKRFDAVEEAVRLGLDVEKVESTLANTLTEPFILTNLKREAYDFRDDITGKYRNYDVVMPITGEILSGAEREYTYERLIMRMEELDYPIEYFAPILKLAKEQGLKPSAGAGFGIERFVRGLLLLDDIAEIYPFKRVPEMPIIF
jgi:asparaginyl-tRNA synthetase